MAFSTPTTTKQQSTDTVGVTSADINTTGSDLIAIFLEHYGGTENVLTDNASPPNVYLPLTSVTSGDSRFGRWHYKLSPVTSATHHFQALDSSGTYPTIYVLSFPSDGTPTLNTGHSEANSSSTITIQPGAISFNELFLIGVVTAGTVTSVTIDSSFATFDAFPTETAGALGGGVSYKIRTTTASENPTVSWFGGTGGAATSMVTFTAGGGVSGGAGTGWPKIFKSPRKSGLP